jgi:serine/threonine protein kinase
VTDLLGKSELNSPAGGRSRTDAATQAGSLLDVTAVYPSDPTDRGQTDSRSAVAADRPMELEQLTPRTREAIARRYDLIHKLGNGGMGQVYEAFDRDTGEAVALKVLNPDIASDPVVLERFCNELRVARKITHRNVCRIYDLHRDGAAVFISMELIHGQSLRQALRREAPLPDEQVVTIARQICAGLSEVHRQNIVHRDLKPENVMIDHQRAVKLMDFGIARAPASAITLTGQLVGTPAYMAPEQAEGKDVDARTDIYALGLVLYEMSTGRGAFQGNTPVEVALKQIRETPAAPCKLQPNVSPRLERVILKCLEKEPAKRFPDVGKLSTALVESTSPEPSSRAAIPRPPSLPLDLARPCALVVEDDLSNLTLMVEIMRGLGWEVQGTQQSERALVLAENGRFDLVSVDLQMPTMDGLEVARRIRRMDGYKSTPLIVVTGRTDKSTAEEAFAAGATLLLHKPIDQQKLANVLRITRPMRTRS